MRRKYVICIYCCKVNQLIGERREMPLAWTGCEHCGKGIGALRNFRRGEYARWVQDNLQRVRCRTCMGRGIVYDWAVNPEEGKVACPNCSQGARDE